MNTHRMLKFPLAFFSIMLLCGGLFGQSAQRQNDIAEISNSGSNVSFIIKVPYQSATLTVSTPNGKVFRQEFREGTIPSFAPVNSNGEYFGAGRYTYELTLTPVLSQSVKDALAQSRIDGNSNEVEANLRKRGMLPQRMVKSGTFTFDGGKLITGSNLDKEPESRTQTNVADTKVDPKNPAPDAGDVPTDGVVFAGQDIIVEGSGCIGIDCNTSGENFGFDTFRLKENNLRLHFDDTSSSASFPSNDWRLVANDTTNGGANRFSIEDATAGRSIFTVEAGAPANSLYVDDAGNVGLNTSTPVVELHVVDGDSPTLRLEQNGSSGFQAQTWDIAGNETNFFIRDVTNGSKLPFRIKPGAGDSSLSINTNGRVGIGFNSNSFSSNPLEVRNNGSEVLAIINASGELNLPLTGGGVRFPDGTVQTTAATGSGFGEINTGSNVGTGGVGVFNGKVGADLQFRNITAGANVTVTQSGNNIQIASTSVAPLGSTYATTIFGGSGTLLPGATATPTVDVNSYGVGTTSGFGVFTYNIPTNPNLVDPAGTNTVFRIRYRDGDGTGTASSVTINNITINVSSGARTANPVFASNTDATGSGLQTVTVCKPANFFNFSSLANHLNVVLFGSADIVFVQVYKATSCP